MGEVFPAVAAAGGNFQLLGHRDEGKWRNSGARAAQTFSGGESVKKFYTCKQSATAIFHLCSDERSSLSRRRLLAATICANSGLQLELDKGDWPALARTWIVEVRHVCRG